jgi:NAD(P)-dependent dehydrogenase (short-subunit alcohol dehydrogenase family)
MGKDSGIIINMDGGGGTPGPNIGGSCYGASKIAIVRLTETLAGELKRVNSKVMVFALNPGTVKSEMLDYLLSQKDKQLWSSHIPKILGTDLEAPVDASAKATMELLKIASRELSGRTFHQDDDFLKLSKNAKEIEEKNFYVMKWIPLKEEESTKEKR